MHHTRVYPVVLLVALLALSGTSPLTGQPPPDGTWQANAILEKPTTLTIEGLGAMQGVSFHDGKVYLYGDFHDAKTHVGVIREYTTDYKPTGRVLWLRKAGKALILHPTGLTWHENEGCFLGDTVNKKAIIYRLDWKKAWDDGHLDNAILNVIDDDAAVNGCRPEFVELNGKHYLATADYGDVHPEVRLYDAEKMLSNKRTSAPGVVAHRVLAGPFNQNLHWDADKRQLTCVQNVIAGRGWRLDVLDLAKAVADGRAHGPGVRVRMLTFPPHDELEGYRPLDGARGLFVTSHQKNNLVVGEVRVVPAREAPPEAKR